MSQQPTHAPGPAVTERHRAVIIAGYEADRARVEAALADPAPLVRQAALSSLARIEELATPRLAAALKVAFEDAAATVRARAAELAIPVTSIDLAPLLGDDDAQVVEAACFACGERSWERPHDSPPTAQLSEIAVDHDNALCREAAVAALGAIGDPAGLPAVLTACSDRVTVRRRAVLALAAFDDASAERALSDALTDKDWQVRQAAEDLLEVGRVLDAPPDPGAYADEDGRPGRSGHDPPTG